MTYEIEFWSNKRQAKGFASLKAESRSDAVSAALESIPELKRNPALLKRCFAVR